MFEKMGTSKDKVHNTMIKYGNTADASSVLWQTQMNKKSKREIMFLFQVWGQVLFLDALY